MLGRLYMFKVVPSYNSSQQMVLFRKEPNVMIKKLFPSYRSK